MPDMGGRHAATATVLRIAQVLLFTLVIALVAYSTYAFSALKAHEARLGVVEQRLTDVSEDERLLAAIVSAQEPTKVAEALSSEPTASVIATPNAPGTTRIFAKVRSVSKQPYGWALVVDPSEYVTGTIAFSMASSLGKLTNADGSFILDSSKRTTKLRLLRDAPVTVVSGFGLGKRSSKMISASDLVAVLPGGEAAQKAWAESWFWLDVRQGYVLRVTQQQVK